MRARRLWWWLAAGLMIVAPNVSRDAMAQDLFAKWLTGASGLEEAMRQRQRSHRPVLLYFYTDWCPYCRQLNTEVLASRQMDQYLNNILAVHINPDRGPKEKALLGAYGVTGYPTVFVLAPGSEQLRRISAYRQENGAWVRMTAAEFVEACDAAGAVQADRATSRKHASPVSRAPTASPRAVRPSPRPAATASSTFLPQHPVTLYLANGGIISGDLVQDTPQAVTLRLEYGEVVFERAEIERMADGMSDD